MRHQKVDRVFDVRPLYNSSAVGVGAKDVDLGED